MVIGEFVEPGHQKVQENSPGGRSHLVNHKLDQLAKELRYDITIAVIQDKKWFGSDV